MENRGIQTDEMDSLKIQIPRSTQTISIATRSVETEIDNISHESIIGVSCSLEVATQTEADLKVSHFQLQPIVQPTTSQYLLPNLISSKLLAVAGTDRRDFLENCLLISLRFFVFKLFVDVQK